MHHFPAALLLALAACAPAPGDDTDDTDLVDTDDTPFDTDDTPDDSDTDGVDTDVVDTDAPAGEVTLTALDAFETNPLGTSRASVGRFVVVQVRVDNGSDAAVSVAPAAFTLESQVEVEDAANATVSALVDDPCPSAPLAAGAEVTCTVVFELAFGRSPVAVLLTLADDPPPLRAPAATTPCTGCGSDCVDLATSRDHCGTCFSPVPADASCVAEQPVCDDASLDACGTSCVDLLSDPLHCGGCDQPVGDDQTCDNGAPS